jgi:hypothetical protein
VGEPGELLRAAPRAVERRSRARYSAPEPREIGFVIAARLDARRFTAWRPRVLLEATREGPCRRIRERGESALSLNMSLHVNNTRIRSSQMSNTVSTQTLPFTSIDSDALEGVSGGVDWGETFKSANEGAGHGAAAGGAVGTVAGGVVGAGAGAVAVPGLGSVPGWVAGGAAGGGIGAAFGGAVGYVGGLGRGIYNTWNK